MQTKSGIKRTMYNFCEYVMALIFVIQGNSVWGSINGYKEIIPKVSFALLFLSVLGCFVLSNKVTINNFIKYLQIFLILLIYILIYIIINPLNYYKLFIYFFIISMVLFYFSFSFNVSRCNNVLIKYSNFPHQ